MLLTDAIEGWLLAKATEVRDTTCEKYRCYLQELVRWPDHPLELEELTTLDCRKVLAYVQTKKWKAGTIDTFHVVLHNFLRWCLAEGLIANDPMKKIKRARVPQTLKIVYSKEEVKKILAACATDRDRLIIMTLLDTGVRRKELCGMTVGDIDFEEGVIFLRDTKGGNERLAYMGRPLRARLWNFLKNRLDKKSAPLFLSERGAPITGNCIRLLCDRLTDKTGIHVNAHKFRHTCITRLLEAGLSLEVVRKVSGHTSYKTLLSYSHVRDKVVSNIHDEFSPLKGIL